MTVQSVSSSEYVDSTNKSAVKNRRPVTAGHFSTSTRLLQANEREMSPEAQNLKSQVLHEICSVDRKNRKHSKKMVKERMFTGVSSREMQSTNPFSNYNKLVEQMNDDI